MQHVFIVALSYWIESNDYSNGRKTPIAHIIRRFACVGRPGVSSPWYAKRVALPV